MIIQNTNGYDKTVFPKNKKVANVQVSLQHKAKWNSKGMTQLVQSAR